MQINSETTSNGVLEREFLIDDVPGVLWSPVSATTPAPLVLMGHGGGLHKKAQGLVARAIHLVTTRGFHVASIDAPGHGDRARSSGDTQWVDDMQRARAAGRPLGPIVSAFNGSIAERAVPEWRAAIDALQSLPEIDADRPVGYTGMTLATEIGARLAVADSRIGAVVLGSAYASEALMSFARCISVPVQFLLPWNDREIDHESGFALFDAFASSEKTMHANPGTHAQVPWFEAEDSANFLSRHLLPEARVDESRPLQLPRG
jgi:cephalosporin-C deacetylase-like acetyl esterase